MTEGQVDDAVGSGRTLPEDVEVGETAAQGCGAGRFGGAGGGIAAGERCDVVAVGEQLRDDRRPDEAGSAGDEDVYEDS